MDWLDLNTPWTWISEAKNNQPISVVVAILAFLGTILFYIVKGIWAIYVHFSKKNEAPNQVRVNVTATQGGIAIGGSNNAPIVQTNNNGSKQHEQ